MNGTTPNLSNDLDLMSTIVDDIQNGRNRAVLVDSNLLTLALFWQDVANTTKKISRHCTKFCIAVKNPPFPPSNELNGLLEPLRQVSKEFSTLIGILPSNCGQELHRLLNRASVDMIQSVRRLLQLAHDHDTPELEAAYRRLTGMSWEGCRSLECLPRTNTLAVLAALNSQAAMVQDAYSEITEALTGDGGGWSIFQLPGLEMEVDSDREEDGEEASWSQADKDRLIPALNIVKAIKLLYKRMVEALSGVTARADSEQISPDNTELWCSLDQLKLCCDPLSERVDNLVLAMYPRVNWDKLRQESDVLVNNAVVSLTCLQRCKGVGTEQTPQHLAFLHTALTHNRTQLDNSVANGM